MKYFKILVDDLDLVIVRDGKRLAYWRDPGPMAAEIARIATKKPHWHITFETFDVPDEATPVKQVTTNHMKLHNPLIAWQKCSEPECVKLQIAVESHRQKKEKEVPAS